MTAEIVDSLHRALSWAHAGSKMSAFVLQSISLQYTQEPIFDTDKFDFDFRTATFADPTRAYHRSSQAYLQGIGDLLAAMTNSFQNGLPLLVASGTLGRSITEYAARAVFVTDTTASFPERVARAAYLLNDGFNQAGARNPRSNQAITSAAAPFYTWYEEVLPRLTERFGVRAEKFKSGDNAWHRRCFGPVFQEQMYPHLSDLAHGNGAAVFALHDATVPHSTRGHQWTQANSVGRALYALRCALVAAHSAMNFTAPDDTRTLGEIVPILTANGKDAFTDSTPQQALAVVDSETDLAETYLSEVFAALTSDS